MADPATNLHYAANGNFTNGTYAPGADGFNLADVGSVSQLNSLPAGDQGLVYLGDTDGVTAAFKSQVDAYIGNPKLYGFYLADEPDPNSVSAANLKAESDYIHANVPGAKTFMVLEDVGSPNQPNFTSTFTPASTDIDLFGVDPYPVRPQFANGVDYSVIPAAVKAAEASGISADQIVPVYQTFGGGGNSSWTMPTASQESEILSTWGSVVPHPAFDYAYSWGTQNGDSALSTSPELQAVFAAHNASSSGVTAPGTPATPPTTPTGPSQGSTPTTPPVTPPPPSGGGSTSAAGSGTGQGSTPTTGSSSGGGANTHTSGMHGEHSLRSRLAEMQADNDSDDGPGTWSRGLTGENVGSSLARMFSVFF